MNNDRWRDILKIVGVCSIVALASVPLQALAQSVSSQERILFVSEWEGKEEIYVMDSDGSDAQRLTATKTGTGSWQPVWSPDGKTTAFGSDRDGNNEIYVMNADGSNIRRLTHTPDGEEMPNWSPDGKQIVFVLKPTTSGSEGLYVVNADGSNVHRLANYEYVYVNRPVWSPDGGKIAFSAGVQFPDGEWESNIYVIDADGSNVQRLTQHAGSNIQADWSPDGKQLVFDSTRNGSWEIFVMDADGSNVQRLTHNDKVDARPVWSPDGQRIVFHSNRDGSLDQPGAYSEYEIYVMDADGGNVERITSNDHYDGHPDWKK
jgi:Tol biopolymer transport system component